MVYRKERKDWMEELPRERPHHSYRQEWSWNEPGPYTGKGSLRYTRTDEQVYEDVCHRMMRHGQLDASQINVEVKNGEVTLTGNVPDRRAKRLAGDIADSVAGVEDVHNQLQFQNQSGTPARWRDRVGHSGVYPASEAQEAPGDAEAQGMASWGQGERGAQGYHDHGESELRIGRQDKE